MNNIRHMDLFDFSNLSVTIVGAGGLGAVTALGLAKDGVSYMTVIDDDVVSDENLATQLHAVNDIGRWKVDGLKDTVEKYSDDTNFFPENCRITGEIPLKDQLVISAVDSIQARKDIWRAVKGNSQWYIDMRMAAEEYQIFTVRNVAGEYEWYENQLLRMDDSLIADVPCTAKSTFHCALAAAGYAIENVRKIHTGLPVPKILTSNMISNAHMVI
jgi:molybdopterin-synthase adenylyltransferase